MMRIAALLAVAGLLVLVVGCGEEDPTGPGPTIPAPTNLTVQVGGTDTSIRLNWTAPTTAQDIDGYIISLAGNVLDTVTATTYEHIPTSLGTYSVKSYKGSDHSSAIQVSTALHEETNEGPMYWLGDSDPLHPSGYGWEADGNGSLYSANPGNINYIDMVLDIDIALRSPADTFGGAWHDTGFRSEVNWTYENMVLAPDGGYIVKEPAGINYVYVLLLESGNYLKLQVLTYDGTAGSITFKFGYQTVVGFRRLG